MTKSELIAPAPIPAPKIVYLGKTHAYELSGCLLTSVSRLTVNVEGGIFLHLGKCGFESGPLEKIDVLGPFYVTGHELSLGSHIH